jgi:hypothetical protein
VILTGTPARVSRLLPGNLVEVRISGLADLANPVDTGGVVAGAEPRPSWRLRRRLA